jgi:Phage gp6-like head-tail connector protein
VTTYDVGDVATLTTLVYNSSGTLTDATATLAVTDPSGNVDAPSVSHGGTGTYSAAVTVDEAGTWFWTWTFSGTVVAVDSGQFDAADPAPPAYASLAELKTKMRITDTTDDVELADKLQVASRRIDDDTGRRFWSDKATSARQYDITHAKKLIVDDIASATGLIVQVGDGTNWTTVASNLYQLGPANNIAKRKAAWMVERINSWWEAQPQAQITARWGWPAIPAGVHDACLILAARLFRRKDSPEGVAGFGDLGVVRVGRYDPDYEGLIGPLVRPEV